MLWTRALAPVACVILLVSMNQAGGQEPREFVVGCLDESRDGWSLLGPGNTSDGPSQVAEFITSPVNFGPGGLVPDKTFIIRELQQISAASLTGVDVFHLVFDAQGFRSPGAGFAAGGNVPDLGDAEVEALVDFVEQGNALLVFVGWPAPVTTEPSFARDRGPPRLPAGAARQGLRRCVT